jgi:DNA polymerase I-like protein with 3'-5' exonuclease and polymerase domains
VIQQSLFDEPSVRPEFKNWTPDEPPCLDGIHEIELDVETTGVRWWTGDKIVGIAVRIPNGKTFYLPIRHTGGNLPIETVHRWMRRELRNKHITNLSTRFDIHMIRNEGFDLEEQNCTVEDVAHWAALLDDHRRSFSLENISQQHLGYGKIKGIDLTQGAHIYHAAELADYAKRDVELVGNLKDIMIPLMAEQNLNRVRQLESEVIFPVVEMERNGVVLDLERLERWRVEAKIEQERLFWQVFNDTGVRIDSKKGLKELFTKLNISNPYTTPGGAMSFKDEVFEALGDLHPALQPTRRYQKLKSLRSKYIDGYWDQVQRYGGDILRYALHQLRSDEGGTISGRFSSSVLDRDTDEGINIQQLLAVKKQRVAFGYAEDDPSGDDKIFLVRKLVKAPEGRWFLSSDGMQIEYRFFAHYANSPAILEKYKENPLVSFHKMVGELLRQYRSDITYKRTKDLNFAFVFGAGMKKIASMLGVSMMVAHEIVEVYHSKFPEV